MTYERMHWPEPKSGEPHEPRNTPWPGDILRVQKGGPYLRVASCEQVNTDQWVTYEWVKPFLRFWWKRISKNYTIPIGDWYYLTDRAEVVYIAARRRE